MIDIVDRINVILIQKLCFTGVSKTASSYELLVIGRLLVGLSSGLSTCLCTMYLSEIAPVKLRGAIGTVNQLGVTCGLFMAMVHIALKNHGAYCK